MTLKKMLALALCGLAIVSGPAHAASQAFEADAETAALWNFAEGEGTAFSDAGPAGIDLKVPLSGDYTDPPEWVEGKFGPALSFKGSSRLSQNGPRPPMGIQEAVTVEAWIKLPPDEQKLGMGILQYGRPMREGFRFGVEMTGELLWLVPVDGQEQALRSRVRVPVDEWVHVAATYDGQVMKVFINGELENEKDVAGAQLQGKGDLLLGYFSGGGRPAFTGLINGVRVSNVARSEFKLN
jgi:hypothetical protein